MGVTDSWEWGGKRGISGFTAEIPTPKASNSNRIIRDNEADYVRLGPKAQYKGK